MHAWRSLEYEELTRFYLQMGEVIVLDEIHPTWRVHSSFMKYHRNSAVDLDALESSHPVQMECKGDSEEAIAQSL